MSDPHAETPMVPNPELAAQFNKAGLFPQSPIEVRYPGPTDIKASTNRASHYVTSLRELEQLRDGAVELPGKLGLVLRYVVDEARVELSRLNFMPLSIDAGMITRLNLMTAHPNGAKEAREKVKFLTTAQMSSNDLLLLYRQNLVRQLEIIDSMQFVDLPDFSGPPAE